MTTGYQTVGLAGEPGAGPVGAGGGIYSLLPAIGQPDTYGTLAMWCNSLVQESLGVRDAWVDELDRCLNLYLHGRPGGADDSKATVNKVQAIVHTFVDLAIKTPPVVSLEPSCVGDNPQWYLLDPVPGIDINQPIPDQMLTAVGPDGLPLIPEAARIAVTNEVVTEYEQSIFDIHWERARANQFLRDNVWLNNIFGWQIGLYEWDDEEKKHILSNPPAKQWFPDPTVADVKDMAYLGFDWPMDANLARRRWAHKPQVVAVIDDTASQNVRMGASAIVYSSVYTDPTYQRLIVTVRRMWIRNQPCVASAQEAIAAGAVTPVQLPASPPDDAGMMDGLMEPAAGGRATGEEPVPMRDALVHPTTGEEMTPEHPDWPRRYCLRCVTLIGDVVAEDFACETWDMPVVHNVNVPIPNRPFGQGEPTRVTSLQDALNSLQDAGIRHARWYRGPAGVGDVAVRDLLPEGFKDAHMTPETIWWIDSLVMKDTNGQPIQYYKPPELPPAVLTMKHDCEAALDAVSNVTPVMQGDAPPQWSGVAMENQQAASTSAASFKSLRFEEVVWRLARLMLHSNVTRLTAEDCFRSNNKYPLHVVRAIHARAQQIDWDAKVEVGSGAGQAKASKDNRTMELFKLGLIDKETARDLLGLDHKVIEQRIKSEAQQMAQAVPPAPQVQPQ